MADTSTAAPVDGVASTDAGGTAEANAAQGSAVFTADQQRVMAQDMVSRGQLSRQDANAALAAAGMDPLEDPAAQQVTGAALSDKQAEVNEYEKINPPAAAHEFQVPNLVAPGEDVPAAQVIAATQKIQGWMADMRLPREAGNSLLKEAERTSNQYVKMSEPERRAYGSAERAKLARLWGAATDQKIALGRQLIRELEAKSPGIVAVLESTGAGDNSLIISHIVSAAERLLARQGG